MSNLKINNTISVQNDFQGNGAIYHGYAGMDDKYNKYCGTYISWLKALEWAEDAGCRKCNFGGVQGTLDDGLTSYKSRFSPVFEDYIGELDMPVMPLWYRMFVVALPMAKKVLRGIRSWKK